MVMSVSSAVTAIVDAAATAPFRMSRTHVADRWALYNIIIILSDKVKVLFFFPYTNNNKSKEGYRVLAAAAARARSYFCYFNLNLPRSCVRAVLAWVAVCARHRPSSKKKKKKKKTFILLVRFIFPLTPFTGERERISWQQLECTRRETERAENGPQPIVVAPPGEYGTTGCFCLLVSSLSPRSQKTTGNLENITQTKRGEKKNAEELPIEPFK